MANNFNIQVDWTVTIEKDGTRKHHLNLKMFNLSDIPEDIAKYGITLRPTVRNVKHIFKVNDELKTEKSIIRPIDNRGLIRIPLNLSEFNDTHSLDLYNKEEFDMVINFTEVRKSLLVENHMYRVDVDFQSYFKSSSINMVFELPKINFLEKAILKAAGLKSKTQVYEGYFIFPYPDEGTTPMIDSENGVARVSYAKTDINSSMGGFIFTRRPISIIGAVMALIIAIGAGLVANYLFKIYF